MKLFQLFYTSLLVLFICSASVHADPRQIMVTDHKLQRSVEQQMNKGQWELIMLWATNCHVCKVDFKKIKAFIRENQSVPLTVIGVVIDGLKEKEKAGRLIEKHKLDYTHLLTNYPSADEFYQANAETKLLGTPSYLLYNPENKLVAFNPNSIDLDALEILIYK